MGSGHERAEGDDGPVERGCTVSSVEFKNVAKNVYVNIKGHEMCHEAVLFSVDNIFTCYWAMCYNSYLKELSITPPCFCVFPLPKKTDFKMLPHWVSDIETCIGFCALATAAFV